MNIILIGLPRSGKTTLAKSLAKKLNYTHIDTDILIEKKFNLSIQEIYTKLKEEKFRELEKETILNLKNATNSVISLGGGSLYFYETKSFIKTLGFIIYLKLKDETIIQRLKKKTLSFFSKNIEESFYLLKEKREKDYLQTLDLLLEIDDLSLSEITNLILQNLKEKNVQYI
jgi:shikimate kinase